jgi:MOSC domain-containing protein YiiM
MKLLSVNVGLPREVTWKGQQVLTGIFKEPVSGPVGVGAMNLEGDRQADLTVHGGLWKAVYAYPSEHYAYWREELSDEELPYADRPDGGLPWGAFGENLTTFGLDESVQIVDVFDIGSARFAVTEPRMPCVKLAVRFGLPDMPKRFLASRRSGLYLRVVRQGELAAGDPIRRVERGGDDLTVADVVELYAGDRDDRDSLRRAVAAEGLPPKWREWFAGRLDRLGENPPASTGSRSA